MAFVRPGAARVLGLSVSVGAGIAGVVYLGFRPFQTDAELPKSVDKRPPVLWTPPSRSQMIQALKQNRALPAERSDAKSARFSGLAEDSELDSGDNEGYDLLVIGGGATGAGCALDAASRGLKVAMVDREDFASGTSSKSTKLVHGGVRYLQKAILELDYEQWKLVKEALAERKTFLHIAPYLSNALPIMLPVYDWYKVPYYWVGCKMYDFLAGSQNMEHSYFMTKGRTLEHFPMLKADQLVGSLVYYDGQHNDARMNMALVMTAVHHGAVVGNYIEVTKLHKDQSGRIVGARLADKVNGDEWDIKARGVINATGPFCDGVRKLDDSSVAEIVAPSSGVHITLPRYYSPGKMGLIDPNTSDGRVIFFLPWEGNAIAGTTDTAEKEVPQHPTPREEEVEWILGEIRNYLSPDIQVRRGDVLSAWSGIRPLVRNPNAKNSESLVRNHMIHVSDSGLLTISGGKWTTYRNMAQETIDRAIDEFHLRPTRACNTKEIRLFGSHGWADNLYVKLIQQYGLATDVARHLTRTYGDQAWAVAAMADPTNARWPIHGNRLDPYYSYLDAEVRYAVRREYAVTATDVIARRTRLSFLNSSAALEVLPLVISIMANEMGWSSREQDRQFDDARDFLVESMGLPASKAQLTFKEVKAGKARNVEMQDPASNRNIFNTDELQHLRGIFERIDADRDGRISAKDLTKALEKSGFGQVPKQTVDDMISQVSRKKGGAIAFTDFLDVASSMKSVHASNAFSNIIRSFEEAESGSGAHLGPHAADFATAERRKVTPERSGGGW